MENTLVEHREVFFSEHCSELRAINLIPQTSTLRGLISSDTPAWSKTLFLDSGFLVCRCQSNRMVIQKIDLIKRQEVLTQSQMAAQLRKESDKEESKKPDEDDDDNTVISSKDRGLEILFPDEILPDIFLDLTLEHDKHNFAILAATQANTVHRLKFKKHATIDTALQSITNTRYTHTHPPLHFLYLPHFDTTLSPQALGYCAISTTNGEVLIVPISSTESPPSPSNQYQPITIRFSFQHTKPLLHRLISPFYNSQVNPNGHILNMQYLENRQVLAIFRDNYTLDFWCVIRRVCLHVEDLACFVDIGGPSSADGVERSFLALGEGDTVEDTRFVAVLGLDFLRDIPKILILEVWLDKDLSVNDEKSLDFNDDSDHQVRVVGVTYGQTSEELYHLALKEDVLWTLFKNTASGRHILRRTELVEGDVNLGVQASAFLLDDQITSQDISDRFVEPSSGFDAIGQNDRFSKSIINRALKEMDVKGVIPDLEPNSSIFLQKIKNQNPQIGNMEKKLLNQCKELFYDDIDVESVSTHPTISNDSIVIIRKIGTSIVLGTSSKLESRALKTELYCNNLYADMKFLDLGDLRMNELDQQFWGTAIETEEIFQNTIGFFRFSSLEQMMRFDLELEKYGDIDHVSKNFFRNTGNVLQFYEEMIIMDKLEEVTTEATLDKQISAVIKDLDKIFSNTENSLLGGRLIAEKSDSAIANDWNPFVVQVLNHGYVTSLRSIYEYAKTFYLFLTYFLQFRPAVMKNVLSETFKDEILGDHLEKLKLQVFSLFSLDWLMKRPAQESVNNLANDRRTQMIFDYSSNFQISSLICFYSIQDHLRSSSILDCENISSKLTKAVGSLMNQLVYFPTVGSGTSLPKIVKSLALHKEYFALAEFLELLNLSNASIEYLLGLAYYNLNNYEQSLEALTRVAPFIDGHQAEDSHENFFYGSWYNEDLLKKYFARETSPLYFYLKVLNTQFRGKSPQFELMVSQYALDTILLPSQDTDLNTSEETENLRWLMDDLWTSSMQNNLTLRLLQQAYVNFTQVKASKVRVSNLEALVDILTKSKDVSFLNRLPFTLIDRQNVLNLLDRRSIQEWDFGEDLKQLENQMNAGSDKNSYTEILYSFHISRNNYRAAASTMINAYMKIESQLLNQENDFNDFQLIHLLTAQNNYLAACYTAFSAMENDTSTEYLIPTAMRVTRDLVPDKLGEDADVEEGIDIRKDQEDTLNYLKSSDITAFDVLNRARFEVLDECGFMTDFIEIQKALCEEGEYDQCLDLTLNYGLSYRRVLKSLIVKIMSIESGAAETIKLAFEKLKDGSEILPESCTSHPSSVLWGYMKDIIEKMDAFADDGFHQNARIFVMDTILRIQPSFNFPEWLREGFNESCPDLLFRLFVRRERFQDASEMILNWDSILEDMAESGISKIKLRPLPITLDGALGKKFLETFDEYLDKIRDSLDSLGPKVNKDKVVYEYSVMRQQFNKISEMLHIEIEED